jgi:hypothetical protein
MGSPAEQWYYAGREHLYFALETDIHRGRRGAVALPTLPPTVRERLTETRELALEPVALLPETLGSKAGRDE